MSEAATAEQAPTKATRREAVGIVVSTAGQKTIVVKVTRRVPHPRFKKIIRISKKFHAHDEESKAAEGDKVLIRETRPLSRLKCWELVEILKH